MFRVVVIAALLQAPLFDPRFQRFESRNTPGRTDRGLMDDAPLFEFAPTSGAGMTGNCAATNPTGTKGEVLTVTRATAATCTRGASGGGRTTGIADGDLEVLGSGIVRQEYEANGVLFVRGETAATNRLLYFIDYRNDVGAAWADVGTPILTSGQTSPWTGTYASSAVLFNDDAAGAFEGRSQAVTVSAGAAHTMSCYAKAGTRAEVRLSLDGTTADFTGLSTSTWSIVSVTDASSSGVSISAQVLVGDAVGDTGTLVVGGCQVETGSDFTSMNPTTSAAATRNIDVVTVATPAALQAGGSVAISFAINGANSDSRLLRFDANGIPLYMSAPFQYVRLWDGTNNPSVATGVVSLRTTYRTWSSWSGSATAVNYNGTGAAGGFDGTMGAAATTLSICGGDGTALNGHCGRACADLNGARCR